MAKKNIISVAAELATDDIEFVSFDSDVSLLDWDIILFRPIIFEFMGLYDLLDPYQGKPSLADSSSFRLKERSEHWRREIKDAVESGKTVIVFLSELENVYVDTGERRYSGTGRNQKTTRIVAPYDNYRCLPVSITPIGAKGSSIKLASQNSEIISAYWQEFESYSKYKVVLSGDNIPVCLVTKIGDKPVGAIYESKNSSGALVLVPDIDFYQEDFLELNEDGDEQRWSNQATVFAANMVKTIISLDKALKNEGEFTPEPNWSKDNKYKLKREMEINLSLIKTEENINKFQKEKELLLDELKDASRLRNLLFEKGKPLENAIIQALSILGFSAKQYKENDSEFDVVFESIEGRLIGEAEGKDNQAIKINKLRQLEMNIHEDLARDEVANPAKAVLFGNPFRLQPLNERKEPFTEKCISAASRSSTALVFTPDLYKVVKYLSENKDEKLSIQCRKKILNTVGLVKFPKHPVEENDSLLKESDIEE